MMLLDRLYPQDTSMVSAAGHDDVWLRIPSESIEQVSEAHILELVRCGIRYSDDSDSLVMFV